jgi:hypothetical protein
MSESQPQLRVTTVAYFVKAILYDNENVGVGDSTVGTWSKVDGTRLKVVWMRLR